MKLEEILEGYDEKFNVEKLLKTLNSLKKRFQASGLSVDNISVALVALMTEVNKLKKLKPSERKQLIISILGNFIEDICPGEDTPQEMILKQMVPTLIDNINELKLPKGCFSCLKS